MMRKIILIFVSLLLFLNIFQRSYAWYCSSLNGEENYPSPNPLLQGGEARSNIASGFIPDAFPLLYKEREREKFFPSGIKPDATCLYSKNKKQRFKEDKWLGWDKFGHFFISGFLAGASYSIYHKSFNNDRESSVYFASIFTLSLGIGKEVNDSKKPQNKFSYKDLIFDLLGISAGLLIATP